MELGDFDQTAVWVPMAASVATGAIIGFERELQAKAAGLRTHTLVCFSSAILMMGASHQPSWEFGVVPGANIVADPTRMAHGILTGIGFLCAGVIFRQGPSVHGLTTAASLWMCAALGTLYGVGLFWLAVAGSVATLVVLVLFRVMYLLVPDRVEVLLRVAHGAGATRGDILAALDRRGVKHGAPAWQHVLGGPGRPAERTDMALTVWLRDGAAGDDLARDLARLPGVIELSLTPVPGAPPPNGSRA